MNIDLLPDDVLPLDSRLLNRAWIANALDTLNRKHNPNDNPQHGAAIAGTFLDILDKTRAFLIQIQDFERHTGRRIASHSTPPRYFSNDVTRIDPQSLDVLDRSLLRFLYECELEKTQSILACLDVCKEIFRAERGIEPALIDIHHMTGSFVSRAIQYFRENYQAEINFSKNPVTHGKHMSHLILSL